MSEPAEKSEYEFSPAQNAVIRLPKMIPQTNQPPVVPAQMLRMEFLLRARNELNLTPQQHERIEKIIRDGQEKSRKLW